MPGWTGVVRPQPPGLLVHAGRYFPDAGCLVQVVLACPGGRDRKLERAVLASIAPAGRSDPVLWQALGLTALVPAAFELISSTSLVGRVTWEFRRSGRPPAGLTIERIAMGRFWLKEPLGDWLAAEQPKGFRVVREGPVDCAGHDGREVASIRAGLLSSVLGRGEHRLERAWRCPAEQRVYRLTSQQRSAGAGDWPGGLEVHCCRGVKLIPSLP